MVFAFDSQMRLRDPTALQKHLDSIWSFSHHKESYIFQTHDTNAYLTFMG